MRLPCRHIIKTRQLNNLEIFDEALFLPQWTKSYLLQNQNAFRLQVNLLKSIPECVTSITSSKKKPTSAFEKHREASKYTATISQLISTVGHSTYINRIEVLKNLIKQWENHQEVIVIPIGETINTSETANCRSNIST